MTGLAHALIERTRATRPAIRPRLASRFEGSRPPATATDTAEAAASSDPRPRRQQSGFAARRVPPPMISDDQAASVDLESPAVPAPSQNSDRPDDAPRAVSPPVWRLGSPQDEIDLTAPSNSPQPGARETSGPRPIAPANEDPVVERVNAVVSTPHRARPADLPQPVKGPQAERLVDAGHVRAAGTPHSRRPDLYPVESVRQQLQEEGDRQTEVWRNRFEDRFLDLLERVRELAGPPQPSRPESATIPFTGSGHSIRSSERLRAPPPSQTARGADDGSPTRADGSITGPRPHGQVSDPFFARTDVRRRQTVRSDVDAHSTIHVTIGRIEVRAAAPRNEPTRTVSTAGPGLSLESYLRKRSGGGG
jgi:hypothetical protein